MSPPRNDCASGVWETREARGRTQGTADKANLKPLQPVDQLARAALHQQAEHLGLAASICKRLAETLPGQQGDGARECYLSVRFEIARLLALAARPA